MQVLVRDNNVDPALKALKKKMRKREFPRMSSAAIMKTPRRKPVKAEVRRARKLARKQLQREACCR